MRVDACRKQRKCQLNRCNLPQMNSLQTNIWWWRRRRKPPTWSSSSRAASTEALWPFCCGNIRSVEQLRLSPGRDQRDRCDVLPFSVCCSSGTEKTSTEARTRRRFAWRRQLELCRQISDNRNCIWSLQLYVKKNLLMLVFFQIKVQKKLFYLCFIFFVNSFNKTQRLYWENSLQFIVTLSAFCWKLTDFMSKIWFSSWNYQVFGSCFHNNGEQLNLTELCRERKGKLVITPNNVNLDSVAVRPLARNHHHETSTELISSKQDTNVGRVWSENRKPVWSENRRRPQRLLLFCWNLAASWGRMW